MCFIGLCSCVTPPYTRNAMMNNVELRGEPWGTPRSALNILDLTPWLWQFFWGYNAVRSSNHDLIISAMNFFHFIFIKKSSSDFNDVGNGLEQSDSSVGIFTRFHPRILSKWFRRFLLLLQLCFHFDFHLTLHLGFLHLVHFLQNPSFYRYYCLKSTDIIISCCCCCTFPFISFDVCHVKSADF